MRASSSASPSGCRGRLRRGDPLAARVKLTGADFAAALLRRLSGAAAAGARRERGARATQPTTPRCARRSAHRVEAAGTSFYWAMRLLPRGAPRGDVSRSMPSAARSTTSPTATTRRRRSAPRSARWRREIEAHLRRHAAPCRSPACSPPVARTTGCGSEDFLAVIDGMEMDARRRYPRARPRRARPLLRPRRERGRPSLGAHLRRPTRPRADRVAESLGRALQLTNILRDLAEDARARPALSAARDSRSARHPATRAGGGAAPSGAPAPCATHLADDRRAAFRRGARGDGANARAAPCVRPR